MAPSLWRNAKGYIPHQAWLDLPPGMDRDKSIVKRGLMSSWKFQSAQKAQNAVVLYFNDSSRSEWGDTMSVTIPASDAQKLLDKLKSTLHPNERDK
jgi:hypothetical protein